MSKVGLKSEVVKTHPYADAESFTRPWTDEEKAALQEYMDEFYNRFTGIVSEATGIPQAVVDSSYGGGRVIIGWRAKGHWCFLMSLERVPILRRVQLSP